MENTKTTEIDVAAHKRRVQATTKSTAREVPGWVQTGDKIAIRVATVGTVLIIAAVFWRIAIGVTIVGAVGWSLKQGMTKRTPIVVEAATEPEEAPQAPKPKRSYKHRLKVHDYFTGKTISV